MNRAPLYWIIVAALRIDSFIHVGSLSCFLMADKQVALPIDALACNALPYSELAASRRTACVLPPSCRVSLPPAAFAPVHFYPTLHS